MNRRDPRLDDAFEEFLSIQRHLDALPINLNNPIVAIDWLCRLKERAKTQVVDTDDRSRILEAFQAAGWTINANLRSFSPPETHDEWVRRIGGRNGMLRWLIGQGLGGIQQNGIPHKMFLHFAEELGVYP